MKVLVCGGRNFDHRTFLFKTMAYFHDAFNFTSVIEGEAKGADTLARYWAESNQIPIEKYPADWKTHGKSAGPIRNRQMIVEGKPDLVIAFDGGSGTDNMVKQAEESGIKIISIGATPDGY